MNASYFVNNFHTIFSSYTPLTNISVWWFDALQIQPQLDIVSSICKPKIEPTAGELDTLWILNHTFLLDLSVQSSIRSCVERHGLSALAYYNDKDPNIPEQLFTINPYSPGSRRWFLQQSQSLQSRAVGFIYANHRFIWKYSPEQSIQVLQYLSLQNSVSGIREEFEESSNSLRFLAHPLEYTAWFQNQNDFKQQTLILQICAIAEKSTNELDQLFAVLRIYASTNLKVQETMKDCLKTRDLSITDAVRGNFMRTTENPMTTWFASRSLDVQLSTIDYFFQGQTIDISIVFTIQKLLNIFTTYLTFLDSMWMTTNPQVKRIRVHIDSYTSYNLTADLMNFQMPKVPKANVVWFLSQNATRQLEIVDEMCALLEVKQAFRIFGFYWRLFGPQLDPAFYHRMKSCTKIQEALQPMRLEFYLFVASGILSVFMLAGLVALVVHKEYGFKALKSQFTSSLIYSLLILLFQNAVFAYYWSVMMFNFSQVTPSTVTIEAICYVTTTLFSSFWDMAYLYLSYIRSRELLCEVWPKSFGFIKGCFLLSPALIASPVIVAVFEAFHVPGVTATLTWSFQAVGDTTLLILDIFLLSTFVRFVTQINKLVVADCNKFQIISWFGGAASVGCALISIVSLMRPVLMNLNPGDYQVVHSTVMTRTILTLVISAILLVMKYQLYIEEERPKSNSGMSNYRLSKTNQNSSMNNLKV